MNIHAFDLKYIIYIQSIILLDTNFSCNETAHLVAKYLLQLNAEIIPMICEIGDTNRIQTDFSNTISSLIELFLSLVCLVNDKTEGKGHLATKLSIHEVLMNMSSGVYGNNDEPNAEQHQYS